MFSAVSPALSWPHCAHGADPATDPVGCRGIHVPGHTACLAHLSDTDRDTYLAGLTPGSDIDHRGTPFTEDLLNRLLHALQDSTTTHPHLGATRFDGAQFSGTASFVGAKFSGFAMFVGAKFAGDAVFVGAQFSGIAVFVEAQFSGTARFDRAKFAGSAVFGGVEFSGSAVFDTVEFSGIAVFGGVEFSGDAVFVRAEFSGDAGFVGAKFFRSVAFDRAEFAGTVAFDGAKFSGIAGFGRAKFTCDARFGRAQFSGIAGFVGARFSGDAVFVRAKFSDDASFGEAKFVGTARFVGAKFSGSAGFVGAEFAGDAWFGEAQFSGIASFGVAKFAGDAKFDGAQFLVTSRWGPTVCAGTLDLSGAVFGEPTTLEIAAREVRCVRTRWESTATVRLRHAAADLSYAVLAAPVAVTAHPAPFINGDGVVDESLLPGPAGVRVTSVQGVDAALLVLTDTDLSDCLFSGAFHLDQLRLEGRTDFAFPPTGWHRKGIGPVRWTRRRTLVEEHHWRAQSIGRPTPPTGHAHSPRQWRAGPYHPDPDHTPDPEDVAALYRQLRKAFEDAKNEPGAADFYYGECEMRRHDRAGTPRVERGLLWAYWLLSGYGLRAARALGWLAAAMLLTIMLLMGFGLPGSSPKQEATGTVPPGGGKVTFTIDKDDAQNPTGDRFTGKRFEKALNITLNSVVFRSSGQDLTTAGTYIEMTSRLLEPALLALAVLAIRGRIKR
ncbi:pentapeptide repeat-containing protein (plasmid) [Streptomyces cadmiisoli]|uniref:Pentapeptide repeat-containing protein n=2 Tax=Streptomyces cadmiisoli TaxID=2184053 RepID=A0A2Z4JF98_9ACTN|nr:pentapeptide repeat-containing protein [Streptomyces cadmiisoli]AWW43667.1 pentapeptide repeat-containing protein [Streptomyces cadmiisoli]